MVAHAAHARHHFGTQFEGHCLDYIDRCVQTLEDALRKPLLHHRVEDDLNLLLGYLMVASLRGRQLACHK